MKKSLVILIVIVICFDIWVFTRNRKIVDKVLTWEFRGKIEYVYYDEKGIPLIRIKQREYYLTGGYNFHHLLEVNDSLIKIKNDSKYQLVKHGTNKVIYLDNK